MITHKFPWAIEPDHSEGEALMSRNQASSPFGKLTARLETAVDEKTQEAFIGIAAISGMTAGEYLRNLVMQHVHGSLVLLQLQHGRAGNPTRGINGE